MCVVNVASYLTLCFVLFAFFYDNLIAIRCMASTPGFEPGPEASALTTPPSHSPHFKIKIAKFAKFSTEQACEVKFFTLERLSVYTMDTCARWKFLNQIRSICGF